MVDNETRHMDLDCMDLYDRDRDLYEKLVQYPSEVIYLLDQALGSVAQSLGARNDEFQVAEPILITN